MNRLNARIWKTMYRHERAIVDQVFHEIYRIREERDRYKNLYKTEQEKNKLSSISKHGVSDLTKQLRESARWCSHGLIYNAPEGAETYVETTCKSCKLLIDSAHEIERLHTEIAYWKEKAEITNE